jgi:diguanylate cyclase (GGDEF)-like protein
LKDRNSSQILFSRRVGMFLVAFLLFGGCAVSAILLTRAAGNVSLFWPANAVLVWLGLFVGYRHIPEILLGAGLANALTQVLFGDPLLLVIGLPLSNTAEIGILLLALRHFGLGLRSINDPNKALLFVGAACLSAIPSSVIGAETMHAVYAAPFTDTVLQWWAADVVSSIIVLLPLLSAPRASPKTSRGKQLRSRMSVVELVAGIGFSTVGIVLLNTLGLPYSSGIILPLLWIALRCGIFATALAGSTFVIVATGLLALDHGHIVGVTLPLREAIFQFQIMSLLSTLPAFFVATSINSRNAAYKDLLAKEKLAAQKAAELEVTLANMNQGVSCFDKDFRLAVWNGRYAEMFGMDPKELVAGIPFLELLERQKLAGNFEGEPRDLLTAILKKTEIGEALRKETELNNGRIIFSVHAPNPDGGWIATHADVTEKRHIEKGIAHDALHDALTGLPNRRYHEKELGERAAKCREEGGGVALLHVDLDHFKEINDTLGHDAGDAMLVHAGQVLKSIVRGTDFVARVGGDEFVVICDIKGNTEFLSAVADRIIMKMQEPVPYKGQTCRFGVSIGIALQKGKEVDGKQLLMNADIALYRAKNNGRGGYEFFTRALQTEVATHRQMANEIMAGIQRDEFVTFYQPQINARTNEICGVEALVRWVHPTRGLLGPDKFIQIAEESDRVAQIGQSGCGQTLKNMADWKARGLVVPHASVNVSARRLNDPSLVQNLRSLKIPPGTISFEIRESIYLDEADDKVMRNIDQIKELGIDIELDDFGTGYTSIIGLHTIKPKRVKVDRQLVIPIVNDSSRLQIIKSVIDIAKALDIETIAEGVETMAHAKILMDAGCELMQGYGYAGPLGLDDFENYVSGEKWKAA